MQKIECTSITMHVIVPLDCIHGYILDRATTESDCISPYQYVSMDSGRLENRGLRY